MTRRWLAFVLVLVTAFGGVVLRTSAEDFDADKVRRQISRAWGGNDRKAIRVAECESGLNPKATSPGGKYLGLWQFSKATWQDYDGPGDDPREVSAFRQTQVAWRLFQDRRWAPWPSCG